MATRSTRSIATFRQSFTLSGYTDELPAGNYEVRVDEELLEGLSFLAYRRTGTYLTVREPGSSEVRPIVDADLDAAIVADWQTDA
ncbi:MAG: hypothetical protein EAZ99_03475 [Alphaproteobacteria bacterium]|nr:MAG: hypothetical protein EAZ99_03475 [Alphaproteobacteria bacterium]